MLATCQRPPARWETQAMDEGERQPQKTCPNQDELAQLAATVDSRLHGKVRGLRLLARGDGLVLQGQAHCYYLKQLAQHSVMQITRLRILANEIEVPCNRPGDHDQWLTTEGNA
jgi:hypothetical protein